MKILIWAMSILVTSIVAVIIKSAGITLGAIPIMILYAPLFFITPKLCRKWDEHKARKDLQKNRKADYFHNSSAHKNDNPETTPMPTISRSYPHAVTVTEMHRISNYFGKFVKLAIDNLENGNTFGIRNSDLSRYMTEEEKKSILAKPLTELQYDTIRGTTWVKIEPISLFLLNHTKITITFTESFEEDLTWILC